MSTHDTEPITAAEALNIVETMHRAAAIVARESRYDYCQDADAVEGGALPAKRFRLSARLVDTMYDPDGVAAVLRRRADVLDPGYAADQIDPPTVPEPDLTTPEGWIAEAERADEWSDLPTAFMGAQMNALSTALSDCPEAGVAVKLAAIYGYSSRAVRR